MLSFPARLVVGFILGSSFVAAQQPGGGTPPKQAETARAKGISSGKTQAAPAAMQVDVINGAEKRTQVFRAEEPPGSGKREPVGRAARQHRARGSREAEPAVRRVEIFNGGTAYTKTFNGAAEEGSGPRAQQAEGEPVVIGIANGGTTTRNGRRQPVVTGVASSESDGGEKTPVVVGIASSGVESGKTVAKSAAGETPRPPKRRPYSGPSSPGLSSPVLSSPGPSSNP